MKQFDRYEPDYETVARTRDPISAIETLSDLPLDWNREPACFGCEHWQPKDGLADIPRRPGNQYALETCAGCIYSMLDERAETQPKAVEKPRRRVLMLEGSQIRFKAGQLKTESVSGYAGKRDRKRAEDPKRRSFTPAHALPHLVENCPQCQAPCKVERYWDMGKKKEDPPTPMQLLHCTNCGRHRRPEP